jgi:predicted RNase H-like HicB family nuclease
MMDFNVIIEKGEDGFYMSEVVELSGCHTQGKTIDELMERTKEAIELCLEEEKDKINIISKFIGLQKLRIENV